MVNLHAPPLYTGIYLDANVNVLGGSVNSRRNGRQRRFHDHGHRQGRPRHGDRLGLLHSMRYPRPGLLRSPPTWTPASAANTSAVTWTRISPSASPTATSRSPAASRFPDRFTSPPLSVGWEAVCPAASPTATSGFPRTATKSSSRFDVHLAGRMLTPGLAGEQARSSPANRVIFTNAHSFNRFLGSSFGLRMATVAPAVKKVTSEPL